MPKKYLHIIIVILFTLLIAAGLALKKNAEEDSVSKKEPSSQNNIFEESGKMEDSKNRDWWLNSGGTALMEKDSFATNFGRLPENSAWRKLYFETNPTDTDDGYHPQNIFRLVTKKKWQDFSQSAYFYIDTTNLSESENRNESNGILLMSRYLDGDNLYYTGLRTDGYAVIKKKISGKYYTLTDKKVYGKEESYDREYHPNLLPEKEWVGIRSEVENIEGNGIKIRLYIDEEGKGDWKLILETEDAGERYGSAPLLEKGYAGVRTDFMDAKFKDFQISDL